MELVKVEVQVAKETKDVVDALREIIKDIKEGKKMEALTENIGGLMEAVKGYDMIDDEMKSAAKHDTAGYLVSEMWKALEHKAPVVEEAPQA